jgi:TRAP-type C4-dicarboxylate transport system substrate-binding protein
MNRRRILSATVGVSAALGLPSIARPQSAYKSEYRLSTVVTTAFAWGRAGELWTKLIAEGTQGRINAKQYPGASLVQGDQSREFTAMRQGTIDLLVGAPGNWAGTVRELGPFTMPFLFPDHKALDAVLGNQAFITRYFDAVRKAGAEPLALGETGFRQLSNSKRPIRTPADMKGLKFRLPPNPMMSEVFTDLGGNPTVMSFADTQPALASGAVDGGENPMEIYFAAKMHTLGQKYVTRWNYMNEVLLFAVSRPTWESWSAADQKAVRDAAQAAARSNIAEMRRSFAQDLQRGREVGIEIHEPTATELDQFQVATRRAYARWKVQVNAPLINAMEQIVQESRKA